MTSKESVEGGDLYRSLDVWKRVSTDCIVRYRCVENLSSGLFSVQSKDFYRVPLDPRQIAFLEKQYLELLVEQASDERSGAFETLEVAISAHDEAFR
jgi:hypothetical protein